MEKRNSLQCTVEVASKRALELERQQNGIQALNFYQKAISSSLDLLKIDHSDETVKRIVLKQAEELIKRAEKLKNLIELEKKNGVFYEKIEIESDSTGFGYESVFGGLIDEDLSEVDIKDPSLTTSNQIVSLTRFCELLVKQAPKFRLLSISTCRSEDMEGRTFQQKALIDLRNDLLKKGIKLTVRFCPSLTHCDLRFNNGWFVSINSGLDYFKTVPKYSIGSCDLDLRPCKETLIEINYITDN